MNVTQIDPLAYQTGAPVGAIACASFALAAVSGNSQGKTSLPVAASGSITVPLRLSFMHPQQQAPHIQWVRSAIVTTDQCLALQRLPLPSRW